jgi:hypothetical protein
MAWQTKVVQTFGGGINVSAHPAYIQDDQWSWGNGFLARNGCAEILPGFVQVVNGAWLPVNHQPVGICQNPFDQNSAAILGSVLSTGTTVNLWKVNVGGTVTNIPWDAVGTAAAGTTFSIMPAAFLNTSLVLSFGLTTAVSHYSIIRYAGGANFSVINTPATGLSCQFLTSFKSTLVAGAVSRGGGSGVLQSDMRNFAWSSINTTDTWDPAISNSSDNGFLDDIGSGITGMGIVGQNTLGLFTQDGIHVLSPTGGIPLFSREAMSTLSVPALLPTFGTTVGSPGLFGTLPTGSVVKGADNLYLLSGGAQPIGQNIIRYLTASEQLNGITSGLWVGPYVWHKRLGLLIVTKQGTLTDNIEVWYFDPIVQSWSRRVLPAIPFRQSYIVDSGTVVAIGRHWFVDPNGNVYTENISGAPTGGEFVDTKDFCFPTQVYLNRVRVQWECLTNATTDALQVSIAARQSFTPSVLGTAGMDIQTLSFTNLGTLTAGVSDLGINQSCKVFRLRFTQSSGRVRIRGFEFQYETGGDRPITAVGA